jgi:hypothetical protein
MKYIITEEQNFKFINKLESLLNDESFKLDGICSIEVTPPDEDDTDYSLYLWVYIDLNKIYKNQEHPSVFRNKIKREFAAILGQWFSIEKVYINISAVDC